MRRSCRRRWRRRLRRSCRAQRRNRTRACRRSRRRGSRSSSPARRRWWGRSSYHRRSCRRVVPRAVAIRSISGLAGAAGEHPRQDDGLAHEASCRQSGQQMTCRPTNHALTARGVARMRQLFRASLWPAANTRRRRPQRIRNLDLRDGAGDVGRAGTGESDMPVMSTAPSRRARFSVEKSLGAQGFAVAPRREDVFSRALAEGRV
jgi:hypothetical protein